jgi:hypothetical protein
MGSDIHISCFWPRIRLLKDDLGIAAADFDGITSGALAIVSLLLSTLQQRGQTETAESKRPFAECFPQSFRSAS